MPGIYEVLAVTVWEDSIGALCAPNWALRVGGPNSQSVMLDTASVIDWALAHGCMIVVPDHEGPRGAFAAGRGEGHATLNTLRAALAVLALPPASPARGGDGA